LSPPKDRTADSELTPEESKVVLKALGSYQIQLYDKLSQNEAGVARENLREESDLVSSSIKKIHHMLEDFQKTVKVG
jgi:hypothetical protein